MSQKIMVAFDLVGTLVRGEAFYEARNHLEFDLDWLDFGQQAWDDAELKVDFKHRFDYKDVLRQLLELSVQVLYEEFRDYLLSHVIDYLYDEVCEILGKLTEQGIRLGFVTDGPDEVEGDMIRRILCASGVPVEECVIVTGKRNGYPKDEGEPFVRLIDMAQQYGIGQKSIVFVGDKPKADIGGPQMVGIEMPVLIRREKQSSPPQPEYSPWRTISNLYEVFGLLSELTFSGREA